MEERVFPLERTKEMNILGHLWTGSISGQIIVMALLLVGILFMDNQDYNILSIIFFFGFFVPFAALFHFRFVNKGKKLMRDHCIVRWDEENSFLKFETGFPNTNDPTQQGVKVDDRVSHIEIRGNDVGGYHLRLLVKEENKLDQTIRLGLWLDFEEVLDQANNLGEMINRKVVINTKDED